MVSRVSPATKCALLVLLPGLAFATASRWTARAVPLPSFGTDALSRLTNASFGRLNATDTAIIDDPNVALRRDLGWAMDDLGNWVGDATWPTSGDPGFIVSVEPTAPPLGAGAMIF